MFAFAESKGPLTHINHTLTRTQFTIRFHPLIQRAKRILDRGELGPIKCITWKPMFPKLTKEDNIRYKYDLGGGGLMDMGCTSPRSLVRPYHSHLN